MSYDVVVVGGGIGGLTVAALLSARGVNVCLLERQSQVGGCIGRVEFGGYDFEPGMGLYTSFGPGGVYEKLFSELPVDAPRVSLLGSPLVIRQSDGADVIDTSHGHLYVVDGGPASLAERLAEAIKRSGGNVRLNSPVLRLSYDDSGRATGVDLLSGERMFASKAIVSNLTIWDTYGKLVGLNRTPPEIKKHLNSLQGTGVYVVYASIRASAAARLPSPRMLVKDTEGEFTVAVANGAATFTTRTEVDEWFTYQTSEEDYEEWDQAALEQFWTRIHKSLPELGSDGEIIESANPRTYYDQTRRKLGMVLGTTPAQGSDPRTSVPNLFITGDTVTPNPRLDSVVESAIQLAQRIV
ncbi:MAG TPA: FAD-dependent oxidoreductase [Pyrinomonadaceae bacterium]|nr:FAD-dependent oxidoreductase [Pyrinomonadaceae bacterium]